MEDHGRFIGTHEGFPAGDFMHRQIQEGKGHAVGHIEQIHSIQQGQAFQFSHGEGASVQHGADDRFQASAQQRDGFRHVEIRGVFHAHGVYAARHADIKTQFRLCGGRSQRHTFHAMPAQLKRARIKGLHGQHHIV